jgi:hypothetical protein
MRKLPDRERKQTRYVKKQSGSKRPQHHTRSHLWLCATLEERHSSKESWQRTSTPCRAGKTGGSGLPLSSSRDQPQQTRRNRPRRQAGDLVPCE